MFAPAEVARLRALVLRGNSVPVRCQLRNHDEFAPERGFSLVEMLVVLVVLGILTAVVVFAVGGSSEDAEIKACVMEREQMVKAIAEFEAATGRYPENVVEMVEGVGASDAGAVLPRLPTYWKPAGSGVVRTGVDQLSIAQCGPATEI
jgi:prepilin-type N-terminal cleavage/methylation domain-containing protein